ncbi:hypothetical protein NCLIV_037580 [Neospora caninum Liverpool]|uniref:protein-tyrosine-phosphatase n=1 Tax=Neospora caninum (strain Liverpool) TaxID=572307 RepID=F0VJR5_NEOCL|nr:hypothetical protein NCLIV_037580 [Neospora caninum Liverpool]CBZ53976.1 hypothetical protein NCLIV_037580 [Neospora caninum Liverpool]|eukprot:XP_003884008.1 hypothetical protein NCLIV_037580 [Neospora caninum Liverpool]
MSRSSAGFVPAGGPSGGPAFSFFAHFSPLSGQQKQAAHQILPHLFLGSAAAARSATWLHQNRITHIVCVHNAEASPQELKRQLTSPTAANDAKHAKSRQQRPQTVAEQLVVHADRCVYCCCYVQDTPQQVFLPMLSPVIDFVDNAIRDQSFRGGGGSPSQVPSQASQPGSAQPRKHPTRNHLFVCGEQQTSLVDDEKEGIPAKSFGGVSGPARSGVNQGNSRAPQHGNVLVHCAKGISRSASFVICYLMFRRCWSYNDSFTYIRRKRPIYPNVGFQIQLQEIEKRLQQFRPTIPRVDASEDPAAPKRITATAVAAGLVGPDEDEPDLFRRDPTAAEKLLEILREARTALNAASLEQKLIASILTQLLETQELVENMFSQSSLLRDRQKWELHGLFFENLKSYGVAAPPDVLATAEKVAKRASDLKLVFTATLPGVAMADTVAEEIRRWVQVATKVAEEREKAQAADRPKKANASGEHASATRVRSSGGDTAAAETSPAPRDKPQDDSKSADGATNGGRSLSPRNTQRNGGPGKPAQRDVSDGLAFSSGKDLFGRQGASTADTLRERLKKIREKRAALVDTSKAPATDQGAAGVRRSGDVRPTAVQYRHPGLPLVRQTMLQVEGTTRKREGGTLLMGPMGGERTGSMNEVNAWRVAAAARETAGTRRIRRSVDETGETGLGPSPTGDGSEGGPVPDQFRLGDGETKRVERTRDKSPWRLAEGRGDRHVGAKQREGRGHPATMDPRRGGGLRQDTQRTPMSPREGDGLAGVLIRRDRRVRGHTLPVPAVRRASGADHGLVTARAGARATRVDEGDKWPF